MFGFKVMGISDLYRMFIDKNSVQEGLSNIAEQRAERWVHSELAKVKDMSGMKKFFASIPDWILRDAAAFAAGLLKLPEGFFKSPLLEAAYNTALAALVGLGRGLADIDDPKRVMLDALDSAEKEWNVLYKFTGSAFVHLSVKDASGNITCPCPDLDPIKHLMMGFDLGGRKDARSMKPGETMDFEIAVRSGQKPCPTCMLRMLQGTVPDTKKSAEKPWYDTLSSENGRRLLAIIHIVKNGKEFDARDLAIVQADKPDTGWKTLPNLAAFETATSIGLVNGEPTEATAHSFIDAVDIWGKGAPTTWSMIASAFSSGNFKAGRKLLRTAQWGALAASVMVLLYAAVFVTCLLTFFVGGWWYGDMNSAVLGAVGTFVCTIPFWVVEGFTKGLGSAVTVEGSGLRKTLESSWLTNLGRDICVFVFIFGVLLGFTISMGYTDWSRLAIAGSAALNIAARLWLAKVFPPSAEWEVIKARNVATIAITDKIGMILLVLAVCFAAPGKWMDLIVLQKVESGQVAAQVVSTELAYHTMEDVFGAASIEAGQVEVSRCKVLPDGKQSCVAVVDADKTIILPFGYYQRPCGVLGAGDKPTGDVTIEYSIAWWKRQWFTAANNVDSSADASWDESKPAPKPDAASSDKGEGFWTTLQGKAHNITALGWGLLILVGLASALIAFVIDQTKETVTEEYAGRKLTHSVKSRPRQIVQTVSALIAIGLLAFTSLAAVAALTADPKSDTSEASAPTPAPSASAVVKAQPQGRNPCDVAGLTPRVRSALGCSGALTSPTAEVTPVASTVKSQERNPCDVAGLTPRVRSALGCK